MITEATTRSSWPLVLALGLTLGLTGCIDSGDSGDNEIENGLNGNEPDDGDDDAPVDSGSHYPDHIELVKSEFDLDNTPIRELDAIDPLDGKRISEQEEPMPIYVQDERSTTESLVIQWDYEGPGTRWFIPILYNEDLDEEVVMFELVTNARTSLTNSQGECYWQTSGDMSCSVDNSFDNVGTEKTSDPTQIWSGQGDELALDVAVCRIVTPTFGTTSDGDLDRGQDNIACNRYRLGDVKLM